MIIDLSPLWQWLQDQLTLANIYLQRPAVQRQVAAMIAVLVLTWLAPRLLDMFLVRQEQRLRAQRRPAGAADNDDAPHSAAALPAVRRESWEERAVRLLRAANFVIFPVLALLSFQILLGYFADQGWPYGLMQSVLPILWLVLGYRLLFSLALTLLPSERAEQINGRYLRPLAYLLILFISSDIFFGTLGLGDVVILSIQEFSLTLSGIVNALEIGLISYIVSWVIFTAVQRMLERNKAEPGLLETVSRVTRYAVLALGAIIALGVLGVDLGTLGWITTGLSVGIGFGLQELFANFASGIVLTFERSVRPGDIIESQGHRGVVSAVGMRATIIRTADRSEIFIPNKELMTKPLIAPTYSDRIARVAVQIGVARGSDIDKTNELLLATIRRHPLILEEPEPGVMLTELGPYSINFLVYGFVAEFGDSFRAKAEVTQMVRDVLAQNNIEIPFPRSDLHIVQEMRPADDQAT